MKTIQPPRAIKVYRLACNNEKCAALMECREDELRFTSEQREGTSCVMTCPHCKKDSWFYLRAMTQFEVRP